VSLEIDFYRVRLGLPASKNRWNTIKFITFVNQAR